MVAVPDAMPVTIPVYKLTAAIVASLLAHVPPEVVFPSVVVEPVQTLAVPVIAEGIGLLNRVSLALQPVDKEYEIVAIPGNTPVTIPVADPTVSMAVLLLLHEPPAVTSARLVA